MEPLSVDIEADDGSISTFDFNTWQFSALYDNIDLSTKTGPVSGYDECDELAQSHILDGLLYDCEIFDWFVYNEDVDTAIQVFDALPMIKATLGITTDYLSDLDSLIAVFNVSEISYNDFIYDKASIVEEGNDLLNAGSNLLMTDFPFGTQNVVDPYQFSLTQTCNNTHDEFDLNAPARIKENCLIFEKLDSSDASSEEEDVCRFGLKIDQFQV